MKFLLVFLLACSTHRAVPDASTIDACTCVLVDAGQQFGDPGVCIDPITGRPGLCR